METREQSPHAEDDPADGTLDELETEVVEDRDDDDEADDVVGGTMGTTAITT